MAQLQHQLLNIKRIIDEHGDQTDWNRLQYNDVLYPDEAIILLSLSRSPYWPYYDIDELLESCISNWLNKKDITLLYIDDLFTGIKKLKCENGILLRLNLAVVALYNQTESNKITSAMRGESRRIVKTYLKSKKKLFDINTVYMSLKNLNDQYVPEQSLLSWFGYIMIRKMLELDNNSNILDMLFSPLKS